jgi:hypothetical protein
VPLRSLDFLDTSPNPGEMPQDEEIQIHVEPPEPTRHEGRNINDGRVVLGQFIGTSLGDGVSGTEMTGPKPNRQNEDRFLIHKSTRRKTHLRR